MCSRKSAPRTRWRNSALLVLATAIAFDPAPTIATVPCQTVIIDALKAELVRTSNSLDKRYPQTSRQDNTWITRTTTWIRQQIQGLNRDPYPNVSVNDATSTQAYALAKSAYESLTEEQKKLVKPEEVEKDLLGSLDAAEAYQTELREFLARALTLTAQQRVMRDYLRMNRKGSDKEFHLDLPLVTLAKDGEVAGKYNITFEDKFFGSRNDLKSELKSSIRKELRALLGGPLPWTVGSEDRAWRQALLLRKLEIFRKELLWEQTNQKGKALSDNLQKAVKRVEKLYDGDPQLEKIREDLLPSPRIQRRLQGTELRAEAQAFGVRSKLPIPMIEGRLKRVKSNNLIQFLRTIPPEDMRGLGFNKLVDADNILSRNRYLRLVTGVATSGGSVAGIGYAIYNFAMANSRARERCAEIIPPEPGQMPMRAAVDPWAPVEVPLPGQQQDGKHGGTVSPGNTQGGGYGGMGMMGGMGGGRGGMGMMGTGTSSSLGMDAMTQKRYNTCVDEYLQTRFPLEWSNLIKKPDPRITDDPKIEAEFKLITKLHDKNLVKQNQRHDMQTKFYAATRWNDMGSAAYRDRIVQARTPAAFVNELMVAQKGEKMSYLEFWHPELFGAHKQEIQDILDANLGSDAQSQLLNQLSQNGLSDLSVDLQQLLTARQQYLASGQPHKPHSKRPTAPATSPGA